MYLLWKEKEMNSVLGNNCCLLHQICGRRKRGFKYISSVVVDFNTGTAIGRREGWKMLQHSFLLSHTQSI
jgi:hypothetical protein